MPFPGLLLFVESSTLDMEIKTQLILALFLYTQVKWRLDFIDKHVSWD